MEFDADVEQALKEQVPLFFRKMARKGLETFAAEKGATRVDMAIFTEAKAKFLASKDAPGSPGGPPKPDAGKGPEAL
jgi:hypothetical protein